MTFQNRHSHNKIVTFIALALLNTAVADGTLMDRRDTLFSWRIIPFSKDPLINAIYNLTSWVINLLILPSNYLYIIRVGRTY